MEIFFLNLVENPLLYIGYILSVFGAAGALLFIAGVGGGMSHFFNYSESADHMEHARTRSLQGLYLCMASLGLWEFIRVVIGEAPTSTLIYVVILLAPAWAPPLKRLITGKSGGH